MAREILGGSGHVLLDDKTLGGGSCKAVGAAVVWANDADEISGAGPMTLTSILIERLKFLQTTQYRCDEYEAALERAKEIDAYLIRRQQDRRARKVEGTQNP